MSEKDRFDWNDDEDFDSLAGEPIEGFADLEDDFDDDYAEDVSSPEAEQAAEAADVADEPADKPVATNLTPMIDAKSGLSGGWFGFFFSICVWAASAGMGVVAMWALGVSPSSLWHPDTLTTWTNYLEPLQNPLNLLAMVMVAVAVITMVMSSLVAKAVNNSHKREQDTAAMLAKVTSLRLENENVWQESEFSAYVPAATFVSETLGAWRLQAARHRHLTGLEGELHRLEKALGDNSRDDLTGRFDSPAVGALSDEMVRYFDDRKKFKDELQELGDKSQEDAARMAGIVQDSRCWQQASHESVELQSSGLKTMASRLSELAQDVAQACSSDESNAALAALKTEIEKLGNGSKLSELLEKGNKLAFQIAMEVARLGSRGERLMPMTESLEELNTAMRDVVDYEANEVVKTVATRLTELEAKLPFAEENNWYDDVRQFVPAAAQMATNMAEIDASYSHQAERLTKIGQSLSDSFAVSFNADDLSASDADSPPSGLVKIESLASFFDHNASDSGDNIHQPADVDPFAVTPPVRVDESPGDSAFTNSTGSSANNIFSTGSQGPLPDLGLESSMPRTASADAVDSPVEKVYDLNDFGAMTPTDEVPTEEVHELSDFGAKPVVEEETVHDLNEFGAVRLDAAGSEDIYDLNEFGAVPLS